jgi:hypothetical protein
VDWRREFASLVRRGVGDQAGAVDYSYRRPARRQAGFGRVIHPALRQPSVDVAMVIDTSGSMGTDDLSLAIAQVRESETRSPRGGAASTRLGFEVGKRVASARAAGGKGAEPEIVRVRCGRALRRLRVVAGGSAVLLDHPRLDIRAERALVALGGQPADCLRMLDSIAGRISAWSIRGRRHMYHLAKTGQDRHVRRLLKRRPAKEGLVAERYAAFVRLRALLWLDAVLPAGTEFDVRVVPPPGIARIKGLHPVCSWRRRLGVSQVWPGGLIVHIPIDWYVCGRSG